MRNYVIINGVNSLTIPGLAIKSLPPITKPIQRTLREEIDGRDGDIITELGYGAYDKEIEIGLFGDFDVDQIIAYFNQKGTITFSNEPDKVYYFQALNQVDYEELIKFREAGVTLHCQPFKYPVTEEPLIEEYEYVTGSGETITLDNTEETTFNELDLKGNTSQTTYSGKNKLDLTGITTKPTATGLTITPSFNSNNELLNIKITGTPNNTDWIVIKKISLPAGSYIMTGININDTTKTGIKIGLYIDNPRQWFIDVNNKACNFTLNEQTSMSFVLWINNIATYPTGEIVLTPMIRLSSVSDATYEPFVGGTASPNPDFPEPINVVSGDNEIVVSGKNMLDISQLNTQTTNGVTITNNGNGSITLNGTATSAITLDIPIINIPLSKNVIYTFSKGVTLASGSYAISLRKSDNSVVTGSSIDSSDNSININQSSNVTACYLRIFVVSGKTFSNHTIYPMLEMGSTKTSFEKFQGLTTYPINLGVENLFDKDNATIFNAYLSGNSIISYATNQTTYIPVVEGETYTISKKVGVTNLAIAYTTSTPIVGGSTLGTTNTGVLKYTTTAPNTAKYLCVFIKGSADSSYTLEQILEGIEIVKGSSAQYVSETPIELCKIGNYQDYIYKDSGKWYLHKEIGKVVLDGTYTFFKSSTSSIDRFGISFDNIGIGSLVNSLSLSSHLVYKASANANPQTFYISTSNSTMYIDFSNYGETTLSDFTTWLSANTPAFYLILATPTNTEITDETLLAQLEAIKNATSYEGQTNVSQTNNDMPFILDVSALKLGSDHLVINNAGNIYAKPTIDIEGTGIIDIYLNDVQILEADLSETNNIVIDTEAMEAYNPNTNALANRQITGDYSKIKLEPGENDLRFSGDLTKTTVTRYKRWL